jgi:hypothetical protein
LGKRPRTETDNELRELSDAFAGNLKTMSDLYVIWHVHRYNKKTYASKASRDRYNKYKRLVYWMDTHLTRDRLLIESCNKKLQCLIHNNEIIFRQILDEHTMMDESDD